MTDGLKTGHTNPGMLYWIYVSKWHSILKSTKDRSPENDLTTVILSHWKLLMGYN